MTETLAEKLAEVQEIVAQAKAALRFAPTPSVALLDSCAELGELAGAYLKEGGYSADFSVGSPVFTHCFAELGDALFALLSFASVAGLPAGDALWAALERYRSRSTGRGVG
jgi:NTP pyrophosphatase (non-canonical NTP hydrolase)